MVTGTQDHDDEAPTHDAYGTDLRRVAAMRDAGYDEKLMAEALGVDIYRVRYAVMVLTGDRDGCPTPEEIEAECRFLQAGWTEEMAVAARHKLPRNSSLKVRPTYSTTCERKRAAHRLRLLDRLDSGEVPVRRKPSGAYEVRPTLTAFGKRYQAQQSFETREAAIQWGRLWLRKTFEDAQAEACAGK